MEFFTGFEDNIPLCCVLFYECVWLPSIRIKIPEYREKMWELSNSSGVLLCPECIANTLSTDKKLKFKNNLWTDVIQTLVN